MNSDICTDAMHPRARQPMRRLHLGVVSCAVLATLFGGCVPAQQRREPSRPTGQEPRRLPTPAPTLPVPTATPTQMLEDSAIGEVPAFPVTPGATPPAQTLPPSKTADVEVTSPVSEPESLVTQISVSTAPNVAAALRLIEDGRQQMREGAYDAALDHLERAVAIDPTSAYGYYFLAQVHFLKKNYDQAVAFASRAASLGRRADAVFQGRIYILQGAVFEQVGRYPDARRAYQQALAADPQNMEARVALARISGGQ